MSWEVLQGNCLDKMGSMLENSIDCIVTDPPYGFSFMGKDWDHGVPGKEFWKEALRVCKPGAIMLAFGGSRTHHRLMSSIEDAGWEIRDCLFWLHGNGFPKGLNIGKAIDKEAGATCEITSETVTDEAKIWEGYNTTLKPSYEPIIMAMKPLDGSYAENAKKWGIAGLNIDASRIGTADTRTKSTSLLGLINDDGWTPKTVISGSASGRWPANIILDETSSQMLDKQSGFKKSNWATKPNNTNKVYNKYNAMPGKVWGHNDEGGASRFFYCAKASASERRVGESRNSHPTVKPLKLMKYLIKMILPPSGGVLLDPFCGSGTTLVAAQDFAIKAIGIELDLQYCEIAKKRLEPLKDAPHGTVGLSEPISSRCADQ